MREVTRLVERIDFVGDQLAQVADELQTFLEAFDEATYLATLPGIGWITIAGLIAEIGPFDRYPTVPPAFSQTCSILKRHIRRPRRMIELHQSNPVSFWSDARRFTIRMRSKEQTRQLIFVFVLMLALVGAFKVIETIF